MPSSPAPSEIPQPAPTVFSPTGTTQPQPTATQAPGVSSFGTGAQSGSLPGAMPTPTTSQFGNMAVGSSVAKEPVKFGKSRKGLFVGIIVAVVVLFSGSAGAYFGYVVPNKPENVWSTALENMGTAYDEMATYLVNSDLSKGMNTDGTFEYTYEDATLKGDYVVKGYESEFTSTINLSQGEFSGKFEIMSVKPDDRTLPNLYLRVAELKNFDTIAGEDAQLYDQYIGNWYVFDTEMYDEQLVSEEAPETYSKEDYKELADAIGVVMKEYVFTSDTEKAIIVMDSVVGGEELYEQDTYHYVASVNKSNVDRFEEALKTKIRETKIGKALVDDESLSSYTDDLTEDITGEDTFDVWINRKTKLMQTIRTFEGSDKQNYTDLGQLYDGGDLVPLFINQTYKSGDTQNESAIKLTLDRKNNKVAILGSTKEIGSNEGFDITANIAASAEPLNLVAPEGAVSIFSLLFGGGYETSLDLSTDTLGLNIGLDDMNPDGVLNAVGDFRELIDNLLALPAGE